MNIFDYPPDNLVSAYSYRSGHKAVRISEEHSANPSASESYCHYLFGKEAEQIFSMSYLSNMEVVDKRQFIDRCLELAIRVNIYLFTHKNTILLLDPRAFNKQCQLYALRICQIHKTYHQKTDEEKLAKTEENRFLHLAFFLNYEFREMDNYVQTVLSTLKQMKLKFFDQQFSLKRFKMFLKENRSRDRMSRLSFNEIFERDTKAALDRFHERGPLHQELSLLSRENLRVKGTSLGEDSEELYTYPKLAGLAYMIDAMAQEKLHFVLKIKVLTKNGCGGLIRYASGPIGENDPAIVFAGFATDGSFPVQEAMDEAKKCPHYLYRSNVSQTRHSSDKKCFYCTPLEMDLKPQQERLDRVMSSATDLLLALGAEFMMQEQKPFLRFFQDPEKYPELKRLFENSHSKIKSLELETNQTRSLAIYHSFTEIGSSALSDDFPLDSSPEEFLIKKDIIHSDSTSVNKGCK